MFEEEDVQQFLIPLVVLLFTVLVFAAQCPGSIEGTVGTSGDNGGDPPTIEGTWAGVVNHTYYCESGPDTIQLDIAGSTQDILISDDTEMLDIDGIEPLVSLSDE